MEDEGIITPIVDPESINALDETGKQVICPSCDNSPFFIEDEIEFHVSCGCETASVAKGDLEINPEITRQDVKGFLFEKWVEQVHGLCPAWRYKKFSGWN